MSQLQKAIARIQRREGPRIGFGPVTREKPRAMLAGVLVESADQAAEGADAKADVILVRAPGRDAYLATVGSLPGGGAAVGALLPALATDDAAALRDASCDFAVSPLADTAAAAVDQQQMGHVILVTPDIPDATLRSLGPLGLDALFVEPDGATLTLAGQLELVRLASFSSTPLLVAASPDVSADELRVLRDSGVAGVVLPVGSSSGEVTGLIERLRTVPPPRRAGRAGSGDMALVPATGAPADPEVETQPIED